MLLTELKKRKIEHDCKFTTCLEDAYQFSRAAHAQGYKAIVAMGGDGTINKVINGFYNDSGKLISKAKLGVIHTGTSPDFCRSYQVPTEPRLAFETLLKGYSKEISIARIEYHTITGSAKIGYFACCASFGIGAQVALKSNSGFRYYLGDSLGTFSSILTSLCHYQASDLLLRCDGEQMLVKDNLNTFIGKTRFIASGMKVSSSLNANDERLYVLSVKNINMLNIIPALKAIYSGEATINKKYLSFRYARTIEILAAKKNNDVEFDGDPQGFLPCKISIASDKLELLAHEL